MAVVAAVFVERNLLLALRQLTLLRQAELQVLDVQPAAYPLLLVVGLYAQYALHLLVGPDAGQLLVVEIVGHVILWQVVVLHHQTRVGKKEVAVGFQVDEAAVLQEAAVSLQKVGGGQALGHLFHLRVAEGEPDFGHLARRKEAVDKLDVRAQEGHVGHALAQRLGGTGPHARALDVDAYEVLVRKKPAQPHGIFAAAAAQLQHDGVVVVKEVRAPAPLQGKMLGLGGVYGLKHVRIGRHVGKFGKFVFAHVALFFLMMSKRENVRRYRTNPRAAAT